MNFRWFMAIVIPMLMVLFTACGEDTPLLVDDLSREHFLIRTHRSETIDFPHEFAGKRIAIGFIYTNCPDICPMTMVNLRDLSAIVEDDDVIFCAATFDPKRDDEAVMLRFAELYEVHDDTRWHLLTGRSIVIDSMMRRLRILVSESEQEEKTNPNIYYLAHTDRITLIDASGKIRRNFMGSEADPQEMKKALEAIK